MIATLSPYRDRIAQVVYEAGPTGYTLARELRGAGFYANVIAPSRTPQTTGQSAKSDRLDSRKLAMWSAKGVLQPVYVPTLEQEGDRQVFRTRDQVVAKRRRVKQQIKSFLLQHGIAQPAGLKNWSLKGVAALRKLELSEQLRLSLDFLLDDLAHYDKQCRKIDQAVAAISRTPRHRKAVTALRTVPGVGPVTAMAMRTELLAPERFDDGRQVAAMTGLAPLVSRSGETVRHGPLMKSGNTRLRKAVIEAAWRWKANDAWAEQHYLKLLANTGEKNKAIAALARRMVIILWRIMLTCEPYRPRPCSPIEQTATPSTDEGRQPGLPGKHAPTDQDRQPNQHEARRRRRTGDAPCPYSRRGSRPASRRTQPSKTDASQGKRNIPTTHSKTDNH